MNQKNIILVMENWQKCEPEGTFQHNLCTECPNSYISFEDIIETNEKQMMVQKHIIIVMKIVQQIINIIF